MPRPIRYIDARNIPLIEEAAMASDRVFRKPPEPKPRNRLARWWRRLIEYLIG